MQLGIVEGIIDMIVGLIMTLAKLIEFILAMLLQPLDNGRHYNEMCRGLITRSKARGLRKTVDDWKDEFVAADQDKKAAMLG